MFDDHVVHKDESGSHLIYIDRHLVHEVTSPQAFEGLRDAGRKVRRPDCTLATVDHNIPTASRVAFKNVESFVEQEDSKLQVMTLEQNVQDFGVTYFGMADDRQGIVHVIGPEQGFTLPGTTVVCGDSHTSTTEPLVLWHLVLVPRKSSTFWPHRPLSQTKIEKHAS